MIAYLIKSVLCSALLIAAYYIFLEKEKIHTFKRFYLPLCLILSLLLPLVTIETPLPGQWLEEITVPQQKINETILSTPHPIQQASEFSPYSLLKFAYILISVILLFRFTANLIALLSKIRNHKKIAYQNSFIILDDKISVPFTFLNYIFLCKKDFDNPQILTHELTHVDQKHTLDILIIEFMQCLMWFNPALPFYKKAIQLNHEFIADQGVLKNYPINEYQLMLLHQSSLHPIPLTSSFNYSVTKKRFVMMTTTKNHFRAMIKVIMSLIIICCAAITFPQRVYSQPPFQKTIIIPDPSTQQSDTLEFDVLIEETRQVRKNKNGQTYAYYDLSSLSAEKKKKMIELYEQLSEEQKLVNYRSTYAFFLYPRPIPIKQSPGSTQFASWEDEKTYGVWLDGRRISNSDLKKYIPSDIVYFSQSRLLKNAAHYGQYKFQVNLMTHAYFDKTYTKKSN